MTIPTKYRKKPVVIETMRWDGTAENASSIIEWALSNDGTIRYTCGPENGCSGEAGVHWLDIDTLEGTMRATPDDWIIRGVQNEFYSCKPDIFAQTYELDTGEPPTVHHGDIGGLSLVQITSAVDHPPHVRIERAGVVLADGYVTPSLRDALRWIGTPEPAGATNTTPAHQDTTEPLSDRLRALAEQLRAERPFIAGMLLGFASLAAQTERRELRVRTLADTLAREARDLDTAGARHDATLTRNIVKLLSTALDARIIITDLEQNG